MTTATVIPFPGIKPAPLVRRSIPLPTILAYLENTALVLDGLGEVCRDDPAIREAMTTASTSIRDAGSILAGKAG